MSTTPLPIPPALWRKPLCILALGFGAGALPKAPGTWGTLVAVPFYLVLQPLPLAEYALVVLILFGAGVGWCGKTAQLLGVHDHPAIVWDEMVGFWVTMAIAPDGWRWMVSGFVLFRLFDIWKPWPIHRLDKQVAGGLGIMADDVVAGVYAAVCLSLGKLVFLPT
jgi:phosphatidylglycerophosphatase A